MTKALMIAVFGFLLAAPVSASACSDFFFPCGTGPGAPREELIVYAWGPGTTAQSPFNNYNQPTYYQPAYQSQQYFQPAYQPMYQQYKPMYYEPQYSYYQPAYNYYQPTYYSQPSYVPQYDYYNYYDSQPYFGYSAQPTGQTDFWGNDLCNWGDYQGYACDRDPHQWIQDSYTGEWY